MHVKFVRTTNVRNYLAAYERLKDRGSREAGWGFASGEPGLGKTKTLQWHAIDQDAPYVRAKANWTASWMLTEIAAEFGIAASGSIKALFAEVLGGMARSQKPLMVDEVGLMLAERKLMETLRDLSDMAECPVILGGEPDALRQITTRYKAVRSRISEPVEFKPATLEDIRQICAETCEVPVGDGVVEEIMHQSSGYYREVKNAIAAVERLARVQSVERIEMSNIQGKRLCQDRRDVRVRAGV
jgi:hypothetical protein